ncbi:unnamed protein product [Amoebophrya sp. A25]|nr:unnamed protein product [Amoebophrya sp. A25]|eukprot:GSA25T00011171001.1
MLHHPGGKRGSDHDVGQKNCVRLLFPSDAKLYIFSKLSYFFIVRTKRGAKTTEGQTAIHTSGTTRINYHLHQILLGTSTVKMCFRRGGGFRERVDDWLLELEVKMMVRTSSRS